MKEIKGFNELVESEVVESKGLKVGIYPAKIVQVEDVPEKEYLRVYIDIADGEYKGYFDKIAKANGNVFPYQGIWYASYKESASGFFKAFITAVQKSNQNYVWNWNEQSLVGKYCIAVFGEEEYINKDGELRTSIKMREIRSIPAWKANEIKMPTLKKLKVQPVNATPAVNIPDDELPF